MVKVYSRIGCAPCKALKQYLDFIKVDYQETLDHNYPMSPTIEFEDGQVFSGFTTPVRVKLNKLTRASII